MKLVSLLNEERSIKKQIDKLKLKLRSSRDSETSVRIGNTMDLLIKQLTNIEKEIDSFINNKS